MQRPAFDPQDFLRSEYQTELRTREDAVASGRRLVGALQATGLPAGTLKPIADELADLLELIRMQDDRNRAFRRLVLAILSQNDGPVELFRGDLTPLRDAQEIVITPTGLGWLFTVANPRGGAA